MKKLIKISLVAIFALSMGVFAWQSKAADTIVISMAKQQATTDEVFQQARINSRAEGFFNIINMELLEKKYGYDVNAKVKEAVDSQIKSIQASNPTAAKDYGVADEMELLRNTGTLLQIMEEQYVKDTYEKLFVTDKSLKKLYDKRAGELTSFILIKIDETTFEGDPAQLEAAKKDIEAKLATITEENAREVFEELVKTYPGVEEANGEQNVKREEVDEKLLKEIDKLNYLGFTKQPLDIEGVFHYVLKTDKGERASLEASKERLKDLQFERATEENSYLADYLLVQLRKDNKINFKNEKDQKVYDAATQQIIADYNDAKDGDK